MAGEQGAVLHDVVKRLVQVLVDEVRPGEEGLLPELGRLEAGLRRGLELLEGRPLGLRHLGPALDRQVLQPLVYRLHQRHDLLQPLRQRHGIGRQGLLDLGLRVVRLLRRRVYLDGLMLRFRHY